MQDTTGPPNLRPVVAVGDLPDTFRADVLKGLTRPTGRKRIPSKHLYDARGSELFEKICTLPNYYLTRTEAAIFDRHIDDMAAELGSGVDLIEPGAGSGEKAARLLRALDNPNSFTPIEVSRSALEDAARRLAADFPEVEIHPVLEDFSTGLSVPGDVPRARRVVFFPGSTIGNLDAAGRRRLLAEFAEVVGDDGAVLLGYDLVKDAQVLLDAYNDPVTVEFNLNLLRRMRRELDCDLDPDDFRREARWSQRLARIEADLVSKVEQSFTLEGRTITLEAGEPIHIENSHKFTRDMIAAEAADAGLHAAAHYTDERNWFDVALLRPA